RSRHRLSTRKTTIWISPRSASELLRGADQEVRLPDLQAAVADGLVPPPAELVRGDPQRVDALTRPRRVRERVGGRVLLVGRRDRERGRGRIDRPTGLVLELELADDDLILEVDIHR